MQVVDLALQVVDQGFLPLPEPFLCLNPHVNILSDMLSDSV